MCRPHILSASCCLTWHWPTQAGLLSAICKGCLAELLFVSWSAALGYSFTVYLCLSPALMLAQPLGVNLVHMARQESVRCSCMPDCMCTATALAACRCCCFLSASQAAPGPPYHDRPDCSVAGCGQSWKLCGVAQSRSVSSRQVGCASMAPMMSQRVLDGQPRHTWVNARSNIVQATFSLLSCMLHAVGSPAPSQLMKHLSQPADWPCRQLLIVPGLSTG